MIAMPYDNIVVARGCIKLKIGVCVARIYNVSIVRQEERFGQNCGTA